MMSNDARDQSTKSEGGWSAYTDGDSYYGDGDDDDDTMSDVKSTVSNAQYSVNTVDEVDMLAYDMGKRERDEEERMVDLEVQARIAEALGHGKEADRLRASMAIKKEAMDARHSALDVLQRVLSSSPTRTSTRKSIPIASPSETNTNTKDEEEQAAASTSSVDPNASSGMFLDLHTGEDGQASSSSLGRNNVVTRLLERGGWSSQSEGESESDANSSVTPYLGDIQDDQAGYNPRSAVTPPPPPPITGSTSEDKGNMKHRDANATSNNPTATTTTHSNNNVLGLLAFAIDASSNSDGLPFQRSSSERSEELSAGRPPAPHMAVSMDGSVRSSEDSETWEPIYASDREFKDDPNTSNSRPSSTRSGFKDEEEDAFVNNPRDGIMVKCRDPSKHARRMRRMIILFGILVTAAVAVAVVLVVGGGENENLKRVFTGTGGLFATPAPVQAPTMEPSLALLDDLGRPLLTGDRTQQLTTLLDFILDTGDKDKKVSQFEKYEPVVFPSTPLQIESLQWLADEDPAQVEITWETSHRLVDRFVLAIFFLGRSNVGGQDVLKEPPSLTEKGWMSESDVCFWYGVSCTDSTNDFRVEQLELTGSGIGGSLPSELGWLTWMRDLSLSVMTMTGSVPEELGDLTRLSSLVLHYNELVGTIPSHLGMLTNLNQMHLDNNQLTGSIPTSFVELRQLTDLNLGVNQLTGEIPEPLQDLGKDAVVVGTNKFDSCNAALYHC